MNLAARRRISCYLFMGSVVPFLLSAVTFWYWFHGWSKPAWLLHNLHWYWWAGFLSLSFLLIAVGAYVTPQFWEGRNRFTTPLDDDSHRLRLDPEAQNMTSPKE